MKLLKFENYKIVIEPEFLALKPFREIWQRDKSKHKDRAIQEIAYIFFMSDPRSDYQYLVDEEERSKAIKEGEGIDSKWKPDKVVLDAITFYKSFKPTSALLLEDTRAMINGYRLKLREITADMSNLDIKEIKDLGAVIKQIPSLIKDLDEAEKALNSELKTSGRMRGSGEKTLFEDGINM